MAHWPVNDNDTITNYRCVKAKVLGFNANMIFSDTPAV